MKRLTLALVVVGIITSVVPAALAQVPPQLPQAPPPPTLQQLMGAMSQDWTAVTSAISHFIDSQNKVLEELTKQVAAAEAQKQTLIEWLEKAQAEAKGSK